MLSTKERKPLDLAEMRQVEIALASRIDRFGAMRVKRRPRTYDLQLAACNTALGKIAEAAQELV